MYAIVDIAGQQIKVEKDQKVFVHRLEGDEGSKVEFSEVLLVDDKGKELLNPLQVCQKVFEMTFYHYSIKFYEEKAAREKVEGKIIGKNTEIGKLQQEVKELKERLDDKGNTKKS